MKRFFEASRNFSVLLTVIALLALFTTEAFAGAEDYVLLSKKGARWEYQVNWKAERSLSSSRKGTLTIVNEGEATFEGKKATLFSWTYGGEVSMLMNLYLFPSETGTLLLGYDLSSASGFDRGQYHPPLPFLQEPLQPGSRREYRSLIIMRDGKRKEYSVQNNVESIARITVPAGQFETIKIVGRESSGDTSIEWWGKDIGLIKRDIWKSGKPFLTSELVRYSIPRDKPGIVWKIHNIGLCARKGGYIENLSVEGIVAPATDLGNNKTVEMLVDKAKEYALNYCKNNKIGKLQVFLYSPSKQGKDAAVSQSIELN